MKKLIISIAFTLAALTIGTLFMPAELTAKAAGWEKQGNTWFYIKDDGSKATGWVKDGKDWYYLKSDGSMATGWIKDGNNWYYLKSGSGAMVTGWLKQGNDWYYLKSNGIMATGWHREGGKDYYLGSDGKMLTGWKQFTSGKWYYFKSNGELDVAKSSPSPTYVPTPKPAAPSNTPPKANYYLNDTPVYIANSVHISPYQVWYGNDGKLYATMHMTNGFSDRNVFKLRDITIKLSNAQGVIASADFGALSDEGYIAPYGAVKWTFVFNSDAVYMTNANLTTLTWDCWVSYSW